jgi:hypothetical protein
MIELRPPGPLPEGELRQSAARSGQLGKPPPRGPEQTPQSESSKSPERQPLPDVWDVLERKVRLDAPDLKDRPRGQEYYNKLREVNRSLDELYEKGTPRDGLIQDLYYSKTMEPTGKLPDPVTSRALSLEEFHQFRANAEPMSEEEITKEIHKAREEFERKKKTTPTPPFPTGGVVSV